jgi:hypothetical protein
MAIARKHRDFQTLLTVITGGAGYCFVVVARAP